MQMTAHGKKLSTHQRRKKLFYLLAFSLLFSCSCYAQELNLSLKKVSLEKAFREIESKVPQRFVYTREMLEQSQPVTINIRNASLQKVLDLVFEGQPLSFLVDDKFITVRLKPILPVPVQNEKTIKGKVFNENGEPIAGVTVRSMPSGKSIPTDSSGAFVLKQAAEDNSLVFTSVGYSEKFILTTGRTKIDVHLSISISQLDETVIIAYGATTQRLNTGSVGKVGAQEIAKQPVSNPLAALQGRVPGLIINQSSGLNGSGFSVQVRGQNSIIQGSEPLFIIDGVPYAPGNAPINQLTNATSVAGLSPLNLINPSDIESIEVLKDADATAIYGSRGANGVILITTKKGKPGATKFDGNIYTGWSRIIRTMNMLNIEQYVKMRKEAFVNDGVIPTASNAPDLSLWDTTRYTDLKKLLIGGTAHTTDAQLSFSGGNTATQFIIGGGFHKETTVFRTNLGDQRASAHFNLVHSSTDNKFTANLSGTYATDNNKLNYGDPTGYIVLPPNIKLFDSDGKLSWQEGGVTFSSTIGSNPLANLNTQYVGNYQNFISNLRLNYKVSPALSLRVNLGYNTLQSNESEINPSTSIDPNSGQLPYSNFGVNNLKSWIVEPQLQYNKKIGNKKIDILLGATAQENESNGINANATNYSSDLFLNSIAGAGSVTTNNSYSQYRYDALFGRINLNANDQYILNLSGRRDASSRFGPKNRFSNFGAVGGAWIFSKYKGFQKQLPFVSFGKVRSSYGITGNDQIGDYRYIDTWAASSTTYQGTSVLNPTALFNPDYGWEINKKFEAALELGFFKDRLILSAAYFRNRSGNQIVQYTLPIQTGFSSIGKNLDATVQNKGFEFLLTSRNFISKNFTWTTTVNLSITKNKLLSFPGLSTSSYANRYVIGEPLSVKKTYQYLGIDSVGIYKFTDVNKDGKFDNTDKIINVNTDPNFYGGILNTVSYKGLQLTLFFEFKKQTGQNYFRTISGYPFGTLHNQPTIVLTRWQKPDDVTDIQRYTTTFGTAAYKAGSSYIGESEVAFSDASYIRLKNLWVAYDFPNRCLLPLHLSKAHLYVQAQNLFTITKYKGADPENQNLYVLPPLKTITVGMQFTF